MIEHTLINKNQSESSIIIHVKHYFLIDNIFVQFGGRLSRQVIEIPMETNCAPLLADLFPFYLLV